jgi:hypothetical protein
MRFTVTVLLLFCCALDVFAAEFRLKDDSVVIGTIVRLEDGKDLYVDTEHMGEVKIKWDSIVHASGIQKVEVEFFDGKRRSGILSIDNAGMKIIDQDTFTADPNDVNEISRVSETHWEAIEAYTDLGMNVIRGNNRLTQLSFGGGLSYETNRFETGVIGSIIINEQSDREDTRRVTLGANYGHKLEDGWQAIGFYQFESDEQQNLQGRSLLGATVSNRIVSQRHHRFELFGGLALNVENFDDEPRSESPEGILGARYRLRAVTDADATLILLPNLEESGRVRVQFDGSLSFDAFSDFDFKITVFDRYDNRPPVGNDKNDMGVTLGLSWEH